MGKGFVVLGVLFLLVGVAAGVVFAADDDILRIASASIAITFVPIGLFFSYLGWPSRDRTAPNGDDGRLMGTGTILSLRNTGLGVNANPYVEFELQVELKTMAPFITRTSSVVPRGAGTLGRGTALPVHAKAIDPTQVVIDWERA